MLTLSTAYLGEFVGDTVKVRGFVERIRDQKRMAFIVLRDENGFVQLTHDKEAGNPTVSESIAGLTTESAVVATGRITSNPQVRLGGLEIILSDFRVVGRASSPLPIAQDSDREHQLDWRFLSLRRPENHLIMKVQTAVEAAMREFWRYKNFIEIHSPKLMGTASESGAELFQLNYFGKTASLAQSPQFYKQMAMAAGLGKIFEIGPVFRANPSFTSRHDTEFTSIDMEISWIDSHEDVMQMEEELLAHTLASVKRELGPEIERLLGVEIVVPTTPFPRITLAEAQAVVAASGHRMDPQTDLDPEGERRVAAHIREQYGHEFVFVTDYPSKFRAFYHMRHEDTPDLTKSFDLLWKGLEITTGAQREHRPEILERQAREKGLSLEPLRDYLNFFRYGCPPHGGLGLGLTRVLMILLGRTNVREVTYLYRGPNRLTP